MHKLSEYEDHATECRKMATIMRDPVHRKQLEDMAEAWAMLARERKKKLLREFERATSSADDFGRRMN